jgi:hypothetical protein
MSFTSQDFEHLYEHRLGARQSDTYKSKPRKRGIRLSNRSHKTKKAYRAPTERKALNRVVYSTRSEGY